jgi:hypothetical protein
MNPSVNNYAEYKTYIERRFKNYCFINNINFNQAKKDIYKIVDPYNLLLPNEFYNKYFNYLEDILKNY